jgi:hypothetical protein
MHIIRNEEARHICPRGEIVKQQVNVAKHNENPYVGR